MLYLTYIYYSLNAMNIVCKICRNNVKVKSVVLPYTDDKSKNVVHFYYKCCNYLKQSKFLSNQDLSHLYSSNYSCYKKNSLINIVNYIFTTLRANKYKKFIQNKNVLELGCGMGDFLISAKKLTPKSLEGVEMSSYACEHIAKNHLNVVVHNSNIEKFVFKRKYDTIFMFQSIEHVIDPVLLIKNCSEILNKGGHLVIETPNYDSWDRLIFNEKWFNYQVPYHTHIFSINSFKEICKNISFKIIKYNYYKFPNTLTVQFNEHPKWLLIFLWPIYIVEYFISSIFKSSGIVSIVLQKK